MSLKGAWFEQEVICLCKWTIFCRAAWNSKDRSSHVHTGLPGTGDEREPTWQTGKLVNRLNTPTGIHIIWWMQDLDVLFLNSYFKNISWFTISANLSFPCDWHVNMCSNFSSAFQKLYIGVHVVYVLAFNCVSQSIFNWSLLVWIYLSRSIHWRCMVMHSLFWYVMPAQLRGLTFELRSAGVMQPQVSAYSGVTIGRILWWPVPPFIQDGHHVEAEQTQ
jgi:hypothetical protein